VNVRLYVAVREQVHDLNVSAKAALGAVISHCPQDGDRAAVSVATVATDIGAHWVTAREALERCHSAGYLSVQKAGHNSAPTVWKVEAAKISRAKSTRGMTAKITNSARENFAGPWLKDGLKEGSDVARSPSRASSAAVEKAPPVVAPAPPQGDERAPAGIPPELAALMRTALKRGPDV
jgi:hypothetical protein